MSVLNACVIASCFALLADAATVRDVSATGSIRRLSQPQIIHPNRTGPEDPFEQLLQHKAWQKREGPNRRLQIKERRQRAKEFLEKIPKPQQEDLQYVSQEEFSNMTQKQRERGLYWFGGKSAETADNSQYFADPSVSYDKWAQAYRMLGGFIDCDHDADGDEHHSGDEDQNKDNDNPRCSRWMMWAAVSMNSL